MMTREQISYDRYREEQEFNLARQRDELAVDLGAAAVSIMTGGAIYERPSLAPMTERHAPEITMASVDSRRFWGDVTLRQEMMTPARPNMNSEQVITGYAKQQNWALAA